MAKKKKLQLKSNVQRGFATTSQPKREAPPKEAPQAAEAASKTPDETPSAASQSTAPPVPKEAPSSDAFDPEAEELQALQNLVQLVYPKVEKETQRRGKTIQFQQRFAKTLLPASLDAGVCVETLAMARYDAEAITDCEQVNFLADDPRQRMLRDTLGVSPPAESEAKALERALTLWELLLSLGFSREQATMALLYAPNLETEECVAWLVAQLEPQTYRALSFNVDTPQEYAAPKAASMDESIPPVYEGYTFTRAEQDPALVAKDTAPKKEDVRVVTASSVDAQTVERIRAQTDTLLQDLNAQLDQDDPLVDVIEHPNDAWSTARIVALQVDKDRARRSKLLGGVPDDELASLLSHAEANKRLDRLAARAKDMMQQSEMQPDFHRGLSNQRFRERMRQLEADEAAKAAELQREEEARQQRRADIEQLDELSASPDQEQDEAPQDEGLLDLLEEPAPAAPDASVQLRSIATQGSQRTPRSLLSDVLRHVDPGASYKFIPISSGTVHRSELRIQWTASGGRPPLVDTFRLTKEGCASRTLADDYVATIALNCFGRERQVQRHMSPGFRDIWDELESLRSQQMNAFLRDEVLHVQHTLRRRVPPAPPKREQRKTLMEPVVAPIATRAREPSDALRDMWTRRTSSEAYQAMLPGRRDLPIYQARDAILQCVATSQVVVLSGETGCGKSTQLPSYLT